MNTQTNYQITTLIHESVNSLVYRAFLLENGQPIVIKILQREYPSLEEITRYKQEYEIVRSLERKGVHSVVKAYNLQPHQNSLAMLLEDFGGQSLKRIIDKQQLDLQEFLAISIKISESLGEIHNSNIIHKDINPANIVYNLETQELKLIDFGIATVLVRENQSPCNPNRLEGTLAYISPEQTGRMNREIDYRSDFYSLGVTFYELVVGKRPFETTDPMELIHSHIAKQPISPREVKSEVPHAVANIIMKLMAKKAEERYQSAWGLKADLETCLHELKTKNSIPAFTLGRQDSSNKFQIPQKLYGRQEQVELLLESFERASQGAAEMILVAGYSGIGKSALVNEIHKPITRQKGYFIAGKFDQLKRNIPYAALIQALQELVKQLLTESEAELQLWRQKLLETLGNNGQIIVDVIPEVELIVGKQPAIPQLGPTETQNRFNLVFQNFLRTFAQKEHPLVIFIDDLQWADLASLKLLELLMTNDECQYLSLIGAYRDNEVSAAHPLIQTLERIKAQNAEVNTLTLEPLSINWVNQLIADTLKCSEEESQPLTALAFEKTNGNPFFLTQLLQSLYAEDLLSFVPSNGYWHWDIEKIQAVGITDNVVELMAGKIEKLEDKTQELLKLAACIGNQFDLAVLSIVSDKSISDTVVDLWSALEQGLILPLSDVYKLLVLQEEEEILVQSSEISPISIPYKFLHDRVQQAAYALIPEEQKQQVHLQIGKLLLKNTGEEKLEEDIFDLVNQLNIGAGLITANPERIELARLNLMAGKKAKASAAYQAAARYLKAGLKLLSANSWEDEYDLTLDLYVEAVSAEYLNAEFDEAEKLAAIVLECARSTIDKVEVYEIKIQSYRSQFQFQRAIETALEIAEQLGVVLPSKPDREDIGREKQAIENFLNNRSVEDLLQLSEMANPDKLASLRILVSILSSAFISNQLLYALLTLNIVNTSIQYGNSIMSIGGYSCFSPLLAIAQDFDRAYQFGRLSFDLLEKYNAKQLKPMLLNNFHTFVKHWKYWIRDTFDVVEGIDLGVENGDFEYGGYCASTYANHLLYAGENLSDIEQICSRYMKLMLEYKQDFTVSILSLVQQLTLNLQGKAEDKEVIQGEAFDEKTVIPIYLNIGNNTGLCFFHCHKSMLLYVLKNFSGALANSQSWHKYQSGAPGMMSIGVTNFYNSLSHLALYSQAEPDEQSQFLQQVSDNQGKMKFWAENAPENYQHKYDLVAAETAHVMGRAAEAREYYDRAIEGAKKYGFLQEEAIAYERGAEFYFAIGREEIGRLYIKNAYYAYQRWGACAKTKDLEAEYPEFSRSSISSSTKTKATSTTSSSDSNSGEQLDLAAIIKSTNAISSEIVLENLLEALMNILVENAGAERGILVLPRGEKLLVEATKETKSKSVSLQSVPIEEFQRLSSRIVYYVSRTCETVILDDALRNGNFTEDAYIKQYRCQSIACTPLINRGTLQGIIYLENNLTSGAFTPERLEFLQMLATPAAISLENARLYDACTRFVPSQFLSFLEKKSIVDVQLGDQVEREMTVLFADIRDFTTLSEQLTPAENFAFINEYLRVMEPQIARYGGFIDKYIGDAIMALFPNSADDAVQGALAMLEELRKYNQVRRENELVPLRVGIGLHSGKLMLGTVGGFKRMDGTAIGDAVNLSSRVEGLTKLYGVPLLITHETFRRLNDSNQYDFRFIEQVKAKGKTKAVTLLEVFSADPPDLKEAKKASKSLFEQGVLLFYQKAFTEAARLFTECLQYHQGDRAAQHYLQRCEANIV